MNVASSSSPRRYLAIWFPWLPTDRLKRERRGAPDASPDLLPVALVEKVGGALRLAAVDPTAMQNNLAPGLSLADAQARTPVLRTLVHRPDQDEALLMRALEDFGRFTPMIAVDRPNGLMLDVTGCTHLFGGEDGLMKSVESRAGQAGLQVRLAMAQTPQCARALARFGPGGLFVSGRDRVAARDLPVASLELLDKTEQALRRAGLKRLGDLDDRPRAPLAARFGADFPARLARILGDEDIRITPHRPPPPVVVDRVFFEPVSSPEDIEHILSDLLVETADRLEQAGLGSRIFEAGFYRVDGLTRRIVTRTGRPTRDADVILRLFRERLAALSNPLDPGFGFDQMRMAALTTETLSSTQRELDGERRTDEDFSRLIDRLTARLGPDAVLRFAAQESHMPERAQRLVPATSRLSNNDWPVIDPASPPLRPLQMFSPPQPVETLAEVPDGSPLRFRWRRVLHEIIRAEGPERIAGEWWRAPGQRTRDYYRVEDAEGRRFWLFRQGLYDSEEPPRWFIHGLFA